MALLYDPTQGMRRMQRVDPEGMPQSDLSEFRQYRGYDSRLTYKGYDPTQVPGMGSGLGRAVGTAGLMLASIPHPAARGAGLAMAGLGGYMMPPEERQRYAQEQLDAVAQGMVLGTVTGPTRLQVPRVPPVMDELRGVIPLRDGVLPGLTNRGKGVYSLQDSFPVRMVRESKRLDQFKARHPERVPKGREVPLPLSDIQNSLNQGIGELRNYSFPIASSRESAKLSSRLPTVKLSREQLIRGHWADDLWGRRLVATRSPEPLSKIPESLKIDKLSRRGPRTSAKAFSKERYDNYLAQTKAPESAKAPEPQWRKTATRLKDFFIRHKKKSIAGAVTVGGVGVATWVNSADTDARLEALKAEAALRQQNTQESSLMQELALRRQWDAQSDQVLRTAESYARYMAAWGDLYTERVQNGLLSAPDASKQYREIWRQVRDRDSGAVDQANEMLRRANMDVSPDSFDRIRLGIKQEGM